MPILQELQERFGLDGAIKFVQGPGVLVRAEVSTPEATGSIYLHGAHVSAYEPDGQRPALFMSQRSAFDAGKPIRGGVPLIFPWFGPRANDPSAPLHGFARTRPWTVRSAQRSGDGVTLTLALDSDEQTRALWPHDFALEFAVTVGRSLRMALRVHNPSAQRLVFEEALHTYLAVDDVRQVSVQGLAGRTFIDKTDGMKRKQQGDEPIRITGETDRVYLNTTDTCTLDDPAAGRRIIIEKSGSDATVVWNPWIDKAKAMPDFGDDEWPQMICIETVNAADHAITLDPGESHEMTATVRVESR